jgi:hypothetical protein
MFTRFRQATVLALVATACFVASPPQANAVNVEVDGVTYDLQVFTGTYDQFASLFATPANGGTMSWWGNETLAQSLATQLAAALSPTPLPDNGPLFATSFNSLNIGNEVTASYFDLTTLGVTDMVTSGEFARGSIQTYVQQVPFPLPILSVPLCLSATGRLRRLSNRLEGHRSRR